MGNDVKLPLYGAAFAFTALGAAAAVIGVYLLANSDTKAVARCIALALACGLAWKPVIDTGSALVTQTTDQENNEDVAKRTEDLQSIVTGLSTTKDLPATLVEMEQKAARIVRLLPKVTDAEVRADAEGSIRALVAGIERVMPQRPRESVSVLTRLAVAGLETRQPQFAPMVLGALHDVGIAAEDPFLPRVADPARAALGFQHWQEAISRIQDPSLAQALEVMSRAPGVKSLQDGLFANSPFLGDCLLSDTQNLPLLVNEGPTGLLDKAFARLSDPAMQADLQACKVALRQA